jgi:hypothetical protein
MYKTQNTVLGSFGFVWGLLCWSALVKHGFHFSHALKEITNKAIAFCQLG